MSVSNNGEQPVDRDLLSGSQVVKEVYPGMGGEVNGINVLVYSSNEILECETSFDLELVDFYQDPDEMPVGGKLR